MAYPENMAFHCRFSLLIGLQSDMSAFLLNLAFGYMTSHQQWSRVIITMQKVVLGIIFPLHLKEWLSVENNVCPQPATFEIQELCCLIT
jgi:hypothetical protein